MSEQPGRYQRSFPGMVGALAVLLVIVIGFVLLRDANRADPADPVKAIEYADDVVYYRSQATFPLLAPPSLPKGWMATSQRFAPSKPQSWHLGVLTDERDYLGIEQTTDSVSTMVEEFVDEDASKGEPVAVNGVEWDTYTDEGGDVALVLEGEAVTTLVVGTVSQEELVAYVETLR